MKHIYTLYIILVGLPSALFSQNDFQRQQDSLLHVISLYNGEQKLEAYSSLISIHFTEEAIDNKFKYINDFIEEAKQQYNKKYESIARYQELVELFNYGKYDDYQKKASEHMPFFKINNYLEKYYSAYYDLLISYAIQGDENRVFDETKQMYEEAKQQNNLFGKAKATSLMAKAYSMKGHYAEAEEIIKETVASTIDLLKMDNKIKENHYLLLQSYSLYINILIYQDKFDEISSTFPLWKGRLTEFTNTFGSACKDGEMDYYDLNARVYSNLKEYDKAEAYCDSVMLMNPEPGMLDRIYEYRSIMCEEKKEYDKAIYWLDKIIDYNRHLGESNAVFIFTKNKARILCKMGKGDVAWPVYNSAFDLLDSIRTTENDLKLNELRTQYEVDKHIAEKEKVRNFMYFAIAGCILLTIILTIWIYYNRQIAKKNKTLVAQIRELQVQQELVDTELFNKTTFEIEEYTNEDLCPENRKDKLCLAIRDIMLKEKAYRDPSITRDSLIERLGTNKDLFIDAFQYCFGLSFPEYINSLRLKDSITLLEQSDLSIEEISDKVGFGTVRTFQRQFQSKYNMSPKNYRKLAIK